MHVQCHKSSECSGQELVRDGLNELRLLLVGFDEVSRAWPHGLPLEVHLLPRLLGDAALLLVLLDAPQEVFSAARVLHVLNTNVNTLGDDPVSRKRKQSLVNYLHNAIMLV